ncbi:hypothetical protein ACWEGE_15645 [Amycolatopsis sp. NPDC004747]
MHGTSYGKVYWLLAEDGVTLHFRGWASRA